MKTLPALMLAAAGVGFGHAVMPDHWMPLAVLSRTRSYPTRRTVRLSLAAGVAHVLVSLALGAVLVLVGSQFRQTVSRHTDVVIGGVLLVTGMVFLVMELAGRGHGHSHDGDHTHDHGSAHDHGQDSKHDHGHGHRHGSMNARDHDHGSKHAHDHDQGSKHKHPHTPHRTPQSLAALVIPFGAAASPDLTVLPIFLAAGALGTGAAMGSLVAFAMATVATIVGLTTATAAGAKLLTASWIDRGANLLTAGTLLLIGGLVAGGVI